MRITESKLRRIIRKQIILEFDLSNTSVLKDYGLDTGGGGGGGDIYDGGGDGGGGGNEKEILKANLVRWYSKLNKGQFQACLKNIR